MTPLVLYHGPGCADGFCSAWVARKAMPNAEFLPVQYGQAPPDVTDREVFILDFSYRRQTLLDMTERATSIVVLDHHRTAQADLAGLTADNLHCVFDMDKSGGRLTWEYFFPNQPAPWLVNLTEDRDLWLWKLPDSKAVSAALASHPHDFELWDSLAGIDQGWKAWEAFVEAGQAILRYQSQQIESACANAYEIELEGHKVLAVNTTTLTSEIAGKLAEGRPFGAAFFIRSNGRKVWSLRSRDGGVDVSEIAKANGGGGHMHAAGFQE